MEEVCGAVWTSGPCQRRDGVDDKANILSISRFFAMRQGCHAQILTSRRSKTSRSEVAGRDGSRIVGNPEVIPATLQQHIPIEKIIKRRRTAADFKRFGRPCTVVAFLNGSFINQWLSHRIVGTVITKASVEMRSIEAASDSTALYRAAKSTTTVARGKLQHTSASRANGLTTCKRCNRANRTADCTVTRARVPTNTAGEKRTG